MEAQHPKAVAACHEAAISSPVVREHTSFIKAKTINHDQPY
jgi:hypothetical protein